MNGRPMLIKSAFPFDKALSASARVYWLLAI
ncbi:Uncharacterised protein [Mycobacteroides abscessus subsp. abscessus]|nr:Uncharacterised protein [Mycobacteroides abscessus subsp. abscessus]